MRSPRLLFAALLSGLMLIGSEAQAQRAGNDRSQHDGNTTLSSSVAAPTLVAFPKMATTTINIRVSGIPSGTYWMGVKNEYGDVLLQGNVYVEDGVPLVIDIEKVETGVYTVFAVIDGVEHSSSFCKVD